MVLVLERYSTLVLQLKKIIHIALYKTIAFLINNYQPDTVSVPLKMVKIRTKIKHLERKVLVEDYVKHIAR